MLVSPEYADRRPTAEHDRRRQRDRPLQEHRPRQRPRHARGGHHRRRRTLTRRRRFGVAPDAQPRLLLDRRGPVHDRRRHRLRLHARPARPVGHRRPRAAVDRLPEGASGVLVTPSWQYPNGGTMPVARRMHLLAWAARNQALVIEDDCDSGSCATRATRNRRSRGWTRPGASSTSARSRRCFTRACGSAARSAGLGRGAVRRAPRGVVPRARSPRAAVARPVPRRGPLRAPSRPASAHNAERQAALLAALGAELGHGRVGPPGGRGHPPPRADRGRVAVRDPARDAGPGAWGGGGSPCRSCAGSTPAIGSSSVHYARLSPADILEGVRLLARAAERRLGSGLGGGFRRRVPGAASRSAAARGGKPAVSAG